MKKNEYFNWLLLITFVLISFATAGCRKDVLINPGISDPDGNIYDTVTLGTQTWMTENLKTTRFRDNSSIPLVSDNEMWGMLSTPGFCWYDNDETNKIKYGALYNWYAVSSDRLCPQGWHVPSDEEYRILENYLGMTVTESLKMNWRGSDQGIMLKDISNWNNSGSGTNSTGFTAIPGGYRNSSGKYDSIDFNGYWWSSSMHDATYNSWIRYLSYYESRINRTYSYRPYGFSVRCVKD